MVNSNASIAKGAIEFSQANGQHALAFGTGERWRGHF